MSGTFLLILIAVSLVCLSVLAELDRRERRKKEMERRAAIYLWYDTISSKLITFPYNHTFYTVYNSETSVTYVYSDGAVDISDWVYLGEL